MATLTQAQLIAAMTATGKSGSTPVNILVRSVADQKKSMSIAAVQVGTDGTIQLVPVHNVVDTNINRNFAS